MKIFLILFFVSLVGIVFMIWRKMKKSEEVLIEEEILNDDLSEIPYMDEIKYVTVKKMKEYGYVVLLSSIRMSMKSSHIVKKASKEVAQIVKKTILKKNPESEDPQEVSKFLQLVGDYKRKLKKIKKKIREEEGLN